MIKQHHKFQPSTPCVQLALTNRERSARNASLLERTRNRKNGEKQQGVVRRVDECAGLY